MAGFHLIDEDLGGDGYAWLDVDELIAGAEKRLAAEDAMDEQTDSA